MEANISEREFLHMTPGAIKLKIEKYWKKEKDRLDQIQYQSWLVGLYVMRAIGACFNKKAKYPQSPLKEEKIVDDNITNLSEEEADYYRNQFVKRLQHMEKRFNQSEKRKQNEH